MWHICLCAREVLCNPNTNQSSAFAFHNIFLEDNLYPDLEPLIACVIYNIGIIVKS